MDEKQQEAIDAAIAAVTDAQLQQHAPEPAPTPDTHEKPMLLLPLSERLKRYWVIRQMANERQKSRLLELLRQVAQAVKPHAKPVLVALFRSKVPANMDGTRFMELVDILMTQFVEAVNAVDNSNSEQDKLDELFQDGFRNELEHELFALAREKNTSFVNFEAGVFHHDGEWGVFATKCKCPRCMLKRMMNRMASVQDRSREEVESEIAKLRQQHPGAVEVTNLDDVDLSDHSDEDRVSVVKECNDLIEDGSKVFDLGYGNTPRFARVKTKSQGIELDLGDLSDLLGSSHPILGSILGGIGLVRHAQVSQEFVDRKIAEMLQRYPRAVRITNLDDVDLSDYSDEESVAVLARLSLGIKNGSIIFDLGPDNKPRFQETKILGLEASIGLDDLSSLAAIPGAIFGAGLGDLAEMLQRATSAGGKPGSGEKKPSRAPFSWLSDLIRGQA